jgi:hypothetical protein
MSDLTTLDAVKLYLGLTTDADDPLLSALITSYSQWVRSYCERDFDSRAYEIYRSGRDATFLLLPEIPVTAIALLEIDGKAIPAQPAFGQYGFRFSSDRIVVEGGVRFCWGVENIRVQYTAGYATIPADIAQAVNEIVGLRYSLRDKQGWVSKTLAGETVALSQKDVPSSVKTVLDQYARRKVNI